MQFQTSPPTLRSVWDQVRQLLQQGYSLIPVRDKPDKDHNAKTPYGMTWKEYQYKQIQESELWHQMVDKYKTEAIAMLGGTISGNLEIIDIDNKNLPGVDAQVFDAIRTLFPELWERLRIHKSPSGGYHILYKITLGDNPMPSSKKIASRPSQPKPLCFLETKAEGGYVLVPPSLGYTIHKATDTIPTISWEERCALITICQSFDQIKKEAERPAPTKRQDDYYSVNPFEDYNHSSQAESLLTDNGWKFYGSNSSFIWFSRPGGSKTIHAAFLRNRRFFYFFSTNTEFDTERCYQPATVLSKLLHGSDKKKTYHYLVKSGFGRLSPAAEARILRAIPAKLPENASPKLLEAVSDRKKELADLYPYGRFWEEDGDGNVVISREGIYRVAAGLGFRLDATFNQPVQIVNGRIHRRTVRDLFDAIKIYIKEPAVLDTYEAFLQRSGKFSLERIELLQPNLILRDTRYVCYKFYKDIWLTIHADSYSEHNYSELGDKYIWAESVQSREFRPGDNGCYVDFLEKAVSYNQNENYVELIIGYLAHGYKDETTGYIPILVEQVEDPTDGGGTGKNLFCNLMRHITSVSSMPGETVRYDDNMLQTWNGQKIMVISDVPKNFKYGFLKDLTTSPVTINKKYVNGITVPCEDMCKLVILTNYSYEISDGGLRRRCIPLEFTPFFTNAGGVDVHYRKHFPNDWTEDDWNGYDGTMVRSIQRWIRSGLKLSPGGLSESGWMKQFETTYGPTAANFIKENFENWLEVGEVRNDSFHKLLSDYYAANDINKNYQLSMIKLNRAIKFYCDHYRVSYEWDIKGKENGIQYKYKLFVQSTPF